MFLIKSSNLPYLNPPLQRLVDNALDCAQFQIEEEFNQSFHQALTTIYDLAGHERDQALYVLAGRVTEIKAPIGVGYLCVFIGAVVEVGFNAELTLPYLWNHFISQVQQLPLRPENLDDLDAEAYEQALEAWPQISAELAYGLQLMGQGLVAHLAFAPYLRKTLADQDELLQLLDNTVDHSYGLGWVQAVLKQYSDDLIVIHAEEKVGVKVRYQNLSNCFHLFTLLQAILVNKMPGAKAVNELALRVAQHLSSADARDEAWWHYGSCLSATPEIVHSIWGEMSPKYIHRMEGQQLMLLWSPLLQSRVWDSGFYHPFLEAAPPKVELLEALSTEEVLSWLDKVASSTRQTSSN